MTRTSTKSRGRPFAGLTPDHVLEALERYPILGQHQRCTGYVQQLASFENRVYEVEFEDAEGARTRAVAKFYRPGRWSLEQIQEEHQFMADIFAAEVPVVVPHYFEAPGITLKTTTQTQNTGEGLHYCVYPKVGGRPPEDLSKEKLEQLGRLIARMHSVGVQRKAPHRLLLTPEVYGEGSLRYLLEHQVVSASAEARFTKVVREIVEFAQDKFVGQPLQRIHGDGHAGNILWNEKQGPFFIDFDDMVMGPPIQDLWLLAPDPEALNDLVRGYQQMRDLPRGSLDLVESLRALRMIQYATWIAKRYDDPAFQRAFPHFESPRYWEELTNDLEKQLARMRVGGSNAASPANEEEFEGFYDDE